MKIRAGLRKKRDRYEPKLILSMLVDKKMFQLGLLRTCKSSSIAALPYILA